jgi:hypothetical protein
VSELSQFVQWLRTSAVWPLLAERGNPLPGCDRQSGLCKKLRPTLIYILGVSIPPKNYNLEDENILQKSAVVVLNFKILSKLKILGSTAVADFDLQPTKGIKI